MKTYADLDLKAIREACDLDFAHYTYGRGQCSCCYGPLEMAAKYWRNRKKPKIVYDTPNEPGKGRIFHYELDGKKIDTGSITFILFKNAYNGRGRIKSLDEPVTDHTCISYHFKDDDQKNKVCRMLKEQLDDDYIIAVPKSDRSCIIILTKEDRWGCPFKKDEDNYSYLM